MSYYGRMLISYATRMSKEWDLTENLIVVPKLVAVVTKIWGCGQAEYFGFKFKYVPRERPFRLGIGL
jgi:hypothetical protein